MNKHHIAFHYFILLYKRKLVILKLLNILTTYLPVAVTQSAAVHSITIVKDSKRCFFTRHIAVTILLFFIFPNNIPLPQSVLLFFFNMCVFAMTKLIHKLWPFKNHVLISLFPEMLNETHADDMFTNRSTVTDSK